MRLLPWLLFMKRRYLIALFAFLLLLEMTKCRNFVSHMKASSLSRNLSTIIRPTALAIIRADQLNTMPNALQASCIETSDLVLL